MRFCIKCGNPLGEGDSFCMKCGTAAPAAAGQRFCAKCGNALAEGDAFCMKCGAAVPREKTVCCRRCGETLTPRDAFCRKCGTPVPAANADGQNACAPAKVTENAPAYAPTKVTENAPAYAPAKVTENAPAYAPTKVRESAPAYAPAKVTESAPAYAPTKVSEPENTAQTCAAGVGDGGNAAAKGDGYVNRQTVGENGAQWAKMPDVGRNVNANQNGETQNGQYYGNRQGDGVAAAAASLSAAAGGAKVLSKGGQAPSSVKVSAPSAGHQKGLGPLPADIPTEGNCPKCGAPLPVGSRWCLKCCKKVKRKPTKKQVIKRCVAWVLVLAILSGSVAALWGRQLVPGIALGGGKDKGQTLEVGETPKPGVPVSGAEVPEGSLSRGEVQARQTAASALGISEGELGDCRTTRAGENTFYRFEQRHNGLEVYGRSVILVSSEGETAGVFGNYLAVEDVDTTPKLSAEEAAAKLNKAAGEHVVLNAELTVYTLNGHKAETAWKYNVLGENMMGECLVSAGSGKILYENSFVDYGAAQGSGMGADGQGHTFVTEQRTGEAVYRLEDIGRGIYVYDADGAQHDRRHYLQASDGTDIYVVTSDTAYGIYNMNGSEYTGDREKDFTPMGVEMQANGVRIDTAASGSTSWEDPDGVMLMWALQRTNDFYGSVLGMDSYDDKGGAVYAAYGDGSMTDNAYSYNGLISEGEVYLSFGAARALAVDVIGHEYAHSVTRNVVNWGEGAETTAVSEAYSDIFGELAEDFAYDGEMNNSCNWDNGARNMASPGENGQPSIYKGLLWRNNDDGHNNSTVISHAAYNMCREEFIFTEGLTTAQLARIFKQALHKLAVDCGPEQLGQILMEIAETEWDKGSLNDSQLLRVHLALVRAGLVKLDLKYIPEMDFIRLLAQAMAATVPDYLLDYIGVSREYLEEAYYYQLMEMWVVLNDPEVQEAFREIWEYVISGDPLD